MINKPYKFDLEIKDKNHTGFMNVRETFDGDTPICTNYGKTLVKQKKVMGRTRISTDRQMDGRTDSWTDRVNLVNGGIMMNIPVGGHSGLKLLSSTRFRYRTRT